jgi:RNA polymerase sigma factor (sigma-70 family)
MAKSKKNNIPDSSLIQIVQSKIPGDPELAFQDFYYKHSKGVLNLGRSYTNSFGEAADIMQDSFTKFYEICKTGKEIKSPGAYLYAIARSYGLQFIRKNQGKEFVGIDKINPSIYSETQSEDDILKLLDFLSDEERLIFSMKEFDKFTYEEIAEATGLTISKVRTKLNHSKKRLKELYSK